jgi:hypothetical protein
MGREKNKEQDENRASVPGNLKPVFPSKEDLAQKEPVPDGGAKWALHEVITSPATWEKDQTPLRFEGKKYKSTSWNTPAVYLNTDRLVVFERCDFWHRGSGLSNWLNSSTYKRGARVKLINCRFFELPPKDADPAELTKKGPGKAVRLNLLHAFTMENCEVYGTSGVVLIKGQDPNGEATVVVRKNKWRGVNGNHRDVVPGKRKESSDVANMLQLQHLYRLRNSEISWNDFVSVPGLHGIEDIISIYNSGGYYQGSWQEALKSSKSDPLLIHNNFLRGAHPYPVNDTSSSGSSIICDGDGRDSRKQVEGEPHKYPHLVWAYANYCLDSNNAGTNIAAGWGNKFWDNRLLSAALLPAGTKYPVYETVDGQETVVWKEYPAEQPYGYNAAAMAIFNFKKRNAAFTVNTPPEMLATNSMQGQRVGWRKWKTNRTYHGKSYSDRFDFTENEYAGQITHTLHDADGPITLIDLDFAYQQWLLKVQLVGNKVGVLPVS